MTARKEREPTFLFFTQLCQTCRGKVCGTLPVATPRQLDALPKPRAPS